MMISFNITLVFQMINFLCAYLIIKYGILKPTLKVIFSYRSQEQALHNEIKNLKNEIGEHEEEISTLESEYTKTIASHMQHQNDEIVSRKTPSLHAPHIDEDTINAYKEKLAHTIIKNQEDNV